jgi:hypothetical protein
MSQNNALNQAFLISPKALHLVLWKVLQIRHKRRVFDERSTDIEYDWLNCPPLHMRKSIVVKANGGLGNKMRVLTSCVALAKKMKQEVTVLWVNNYELNCSYFDLFEPIPELRIIELKYIPWWNKLGHRLRLKDLETRYQDFDLQMTDADIVPLRDFPEKLLHRLVNADKIYVDTCEQFYRDAITWGCFEPCSKIVEEVSRRITEMRTDTYYGVHIRRGDNEQSKNISSTAGFLSALSEIIREEPECKFYLSTDDKGEAKIIKKMIGDRLFHFAAGQKRDTPKDIQSALVDLLMLSKSQKIIGSYWSGFSEVAALVGDIPLSVVKTAEAATS